MSATTPARPARMFYVDDSGDPKTGWVVYSWIECAMADWHSGLRAWLDLRKRLFAEHRIPASYELHATKFVNGRGRPSTNEGNPVNHSKALRHNLTSEALTVIGSTPQLRVGTVYRKTAGPIRGGGDAEEVYAKMVSHLDTRLGARQEYGLIFMDGDGTDPAYYNAHRALSLADRNIIEDPLFQHSHRSQWVQMADLVAYAAYQSLVRIPEKEFSWNWYPELLGQIDVNRQPVAM